MAAVVVVVESKVSLPDSRLLGTEAPEDQLVSQGDESVGDGSRDGHHGLAKTARPRVTVAPRDGLRGSLAASAPVDSQSQTAMNAATLLATSTTSFAITVS